MFLSEKTGFQLIGMKPLYLDAFYVSILSEKREKVFYLKLKVFGLGWSLIYCPFLVGIRQVLFIY